MITKRISNDIGVIGIDEVGRGAWSGPLVACSVLLKKSILDKKEIYEINDSKKISQKKRQILSSFIKKNSIYNFGISKVEEIDKLNVNNATQLAMKRSFEPFLSIGRNVKIDGLNFFFLNNKTEFIVKGDQKSISIASASILAKVFRDEEMKKLSKIFKYYDWENNMGYGTKKHLLGIKNHGITNVHRKSFAPIKNFLLKEEV